MASQTEILDALQLLSDNYQKNLNDTQVKLALRFLAPYSAEIIQKAVAGHIESSKWFPSMSELLDRCRAIRGYSEISYQVDPLMAEFISLCDRFYQENDYQPEEFSRLASMFDNQGRHFMSDRVLQKSEQFQKGVDKI